MPAATRLARQRSSAAMGRALLAVGFALAALCVGSSALAQIVSG
jgi:hypothetical protein